MTMGGKPPAQINVAELEKLARLHCTIDEAAAFFGCCKRTLLRYLDEEARDPVYREAWERGRQHGKASLRRLQWQKANEKGGASVQMTIHLSKHWLGETEKSAMELSGPSGKPIQTEDVSARDVITQRIDELAARRTALTGE